MRSTAAFLMLALAVLVALCTVPGANCVAHARYDVHHVPAEYATIALAFADAAPGDTVRLAPGTYYESGLNLPSGVTLDSANLDPYTTTIDGSTMRGTILICNGTTGATVRGVGFQYGTATSGGAVSAISSAEVTFDYCLFQNNTATSFGGAMYFATGTPTLYGCTFTNNEASLMGGALYLEFTDGSVVGCNFDLNESDIGGGAFLQYLGTVTTFTECSFADNIAYNDSEGGGGVYVGSQAAPMFIQCRFDRNEAPYGAGAYFGYLTESSLTACEFEENSASYDGGGAYGYLDYTEYSECGFASNEAAAFGGGAMKFFNSIAVVESSWMYDNSAAWGGAVSIAGAADVTFTNCTIVENRVSRESGGAGIHVSGNATGSVDQSIIAFNRSGEAVNCEVTATATLSCCNVVANDGGDWVSGIAGQHGVDGNFSDGPRFCGLPYWDLYLCANSPCLPAGNDCGLLTGAFGEGCPDCDSPTEPASWGSIKALYR